VDRDDAREVLERYLDAWRARSFRDLEGRIGELTSVPVTSPAGHDYQIELEVVWDNPKQKGDIRVLAAIDDGGWSSISPLCSDFLVRRDEPAQGR
jgi:hypothetical protein